jgi:Arc/MetJ-type ribon-helix-helix transcriptional regulator
MGKTVPILIHFSKKDIEELDKIVKEGHYASRSEALRDSLKRRLSEIRNVKSNSETEAERKKPSKKDIEEYLAEYINEDPYKRLKEMGL